MSNINVAYYKNVPYIFEPNEEVIPLVFRLISKYDPSNFLRRTSIQFGRAILANCPPNVISEIEKDYRNSIEEYLKADYLFEHEHSERSKFEYNSSKKIMKGYQRITRGFSAQPINTSLYDIKYMIRDLIMLGEIDSLRTKMEIINYKDDRRGQDYMVDFNSVIKLTPELIDQIKSYPEYAIQQKAIEELGDNVNWLTEYSKFQTKRRHNSEVSESFVSELNSLSKTKFVDPFIREIKMKYDTMNPFNEGFDKFKEYLNFLKKHNEIFKPVIDLHEGSNHILNFLLPSIEDTTMNKDIDAMIKFHGKEIFK